MSWLLSLPAFILAFVAGVRMNKNHKAHRNLARELYDSNFDYTTSLELSTTDSNPPVSRITLPRKHDADQREPYLSPSGRVIPNRPPSLTSSSTFAASIYAAEYETNSMHPKDDADKARDADGCESDTPSSIVFNQPHSAVSAQQPRVHETQARTQSPSKSSMHSQIALLIFVLPAHPRNVRATRLKSNLLVDIWRLLLFQM
jgi:hypothetical protein